MYNIDKTNYLLKGIILSCLFSSDSIRRNMTIIIALAMPCIGWYKKVKYDKKILEYLKSESE